MSKSLKNREHVLQTISNLNVQILKDFIELKHNFESSHVNNNEISNKLKEWKQRFQVTVNSQLKQLLSCERYQSSEDNNCLNLVRELTTIYGYDQQYIQKVKCLNSTTQMIKQYIRIKAIKDPTTAVYENQITAHQCQQA